MHASALAGVAALPIGVALSSLLGGALLLHALALCPGRTAGRIDCVGGRWILAESGAEPLSAGRGTLVGAWWVRLELAGPSGKVRIVLLRDQLERAEWRALRRALLRPGPR